MDKSKKKQLRAEYKERKKIGGICIIKNTETGKILLSAVKDLQGYKNRFDFSKATGGCLDTRMQKEWEKYGADAFAFEVLEELERKDTQTDKEFSEDIKTLREMWLDKLNSVEKYG